MGDFNEYIEEQAMTVQGRQGNVTFRPYRDIKSKPVKNIAVSDTPEHNVTEFFNRRTTVDNLYPELLCLIFSFLDTESKGKTAQVKIFSTFTFSLLLNIKDLSELIPYNILGV